MSYSADIFVADEQPTTAKWNKLWTNDASFNDGTGIADGAILPEHLLAGTGTSWDWQDWSPSFTNMAVGNGTLVSKYTQVGNKVTLFFQLVFGSTSSISGVPEFSAPVDVDADWFGQRMQNGGAFYNDASSVDVFGYVRPVSATNIRLQYPQVSGSLLVEQNVGTAAPFTWTTGDSIAVLCQYEAA